MASRVTTLCGFLYGCTNTDSERRADDDDHRGRRVRERAKVRVEQAESTETLSASAEAVVGTSRGFLEARAPAASEVAIPRAVPKRVRRPRARQMGPRRPWWQVGIRFPWAGYELDY